MRCRALPQFLLHIFVDDQVYTTTPQTLVYTGGVDPWLIGPVLSLQPTTLARRS